MPRDAIVSLIAPSQLMENHEAKHLAKLCHIECSFYFGVSIKHVDRFLGFFFGLLHPTWTFLLKRIMRKSDHMATQPLPLNCQRCFGRPLWENGTLLVSFIDMFTIEF